MSGILIQLLQLDQGLQLSIPFLEAFTKPLIAWLLSLVMVSIHLWISLQWPNFLVSVTVGFAAAISNLFLLSSSLYERSAIFPWAMPAQAYDNWQAALVPSLVRLWFIGWHGVNLHVGRLTRSSEKMHTLPKHARNDFVTGVFYDK